MTALREESSNQSNTTSIKEQLIQSQKDRTLFCINIDPKCTEDILYELFLQVGPIDNLNRKEDRNGKIIALVTYKHLESCEYAVKLFNGISLFNQELRVRFSQNSQFSSRNSSSNLNTPLNRQNSRPAMENNTNNNQTGQNIQPLMIAAVQQAFMQQLMSPLMQQQQQQPIGLMLMPQQQPSFNFNRSKSGSSLQEYEENNAPRRRMDRDYRQDHSRGSSQQHNNHHQQQHHHHQRRDHSNYERDNNRRQFNRSRSRSPLSKRRR